MNLSPEVIGPRTIRVVWWNTWKNKTIYFRLERSQGSTILATIHTLNRCWRARKPACEEQNDRTSPKSGWFLVEDRSSCRCSWTKNKCSARQASMSPPLIHPRSKSTSNKKPRRCSGAWLSPPIRIAGQKQLKPCPILERAATVDSTDVVNSSTNLRASRWNPFFKYELPILLRAANTRVPARNSSSAKGGNFWVVCQDIYIPLLQKRQRSSLLKFLQKTVDEASQLTKCVLPVIARCLWVNETVGIWNRTHVTDIAKITLSHIVPYRFNSWHQCETRLVRSLKCERNRAGTIT